MFKKTYKVNVPLKVSRSNCITIVNSMLIKLRYYSEKMQIYKRKGSKPNEKLYKKNLGQFLDLKRELKKFGVSVNRVQRGKM